MGIKKYVPYIEYVCPKCLKNFGNRKDSYICHTNKKNPCVKLPKNQPNNFKDVKDNVNENNNLSKNNIPMCIEIKSEILVQNDLLQKFICKFCNKSFSRNFSLGRHLIDRCKIKKQIEQAKETD